MTSEQIDQTHFIKVAESVYVDLETTDIPCYFWTNETGAATGPYQTQRLAMAALKDYVKHQR
jgi:hypothetical protein